MGSWSKVALVLFFVAAMALGCSNTRNGGISNNQSPIVELAYFEGGDGPSVTFVRVLPNGTMSLQPLGLEPLPRKLRKSEFRELRRALEDSAFLDSLAAEASKGLAVETHGDFIGIEVGGILVQRSWVLLPDSIKGMIRTIDAGARRQFPEKAEIFLIPVPD